MSDLSGRTTVVVGASRGFGRGIARAFAEAGAVERALLISANHRSLFSSEDGRSGEVHKTLLVLE